MSSTSKFNGAKPLKELETRLNAFLSEYKDEAQRTEIAALLKPIDIEIRRGLELAAYIAKTAPELLESECPNECRSHRDFTRHRLYSHVPLSENRNAVESIRLELRGYVFSLAGLAVNVCIETKGIAAITALEDAANIADLLHEREARLGDIASDATKLMNRMALPVQAQIFSRAALKHFGIAIFWAALSGLIFCFTWCRIESWRGVIVEEMMKKFKDTAMQPSFVDYLIHAAPNMLLLGMLFTGLVFALRNMSASLHNRVVNEHRSHLLTLVDKLQIAETFKGDVRLRESVILETIRAMAAAQPSGHLSGKSEETLPPIIQQLTQSKES